MADTDIEYDGPEFEVWNHLWSGVDMAANELRIFEPASREFLESLGKEIVGARDRAVVPPDHVTAKLLGAHQLLLKNKWVRHAAEIEIASIAIARAERALTRYLRLEPMVLARSIPARAERYLGEVIRTFAFGFDAACIVLCRATLEQVLREELVRKSVYTAPQLKRERPTAGALLANAKRAAVVRTSVTAAERIVEKGDTVMHNYMYDAKVIEQQAFDSIADLLIFFSDVLTGAEE